MLKNLSYSIIALLLITGSIAANPEIRLNLSSIDFGHVGVNYTVYSSIEIHNYGNSPLIINSAYPSCDCSKVSLKDSIVAPGAFTTVRLEFNTKNWYGATEQYIVIESNDKVYKESRIPYNSHVGQWIKGVIPYPKSLFFLPGKNSAEVTILNSRYKNMMIEVIELADQNYKVEIAKPEVAKNEKIVMKVTADDAIKAGTYNSSYRVKITSDDLKKPVILTIPVKIVRY